MEISFNVSGVNFNAIDYLTELQHIPAFYHLFEDEENFHPGRDMHGFALHFKGDKLLSSYPFSFLRFMVANRDFLFENSYQDVYMHREIVIHVYGRDLEALTNKEITKTYHLKHWFIVMLAEAGMELNIIKYL